MISRQTITALRNNKKAIMEAVEKACYNSFYAPKREGIYSEVWFNPKTNDIWLKISTSLEEYNGDYICISRFEFHGSLWPDDDEYTPDRVFTRDSMWFDYHDKVVKQFDQSSHPKEYYSWHYIEQHYPELYQWINMCMIDNICAEFDLHKHFDNIIDTCYDKICADCEFKSESVASF